MPRQDDLEEIVQGASGAWESKLKPGAVPLLAQLSESFSGMWEHYRQVIPKDEIEKANLPDLDWSSLYKDMYSDVGLLNDFLKPETFVAAVQESLETLAEDRNGLVLNALAFQYSVLFTMNGLMHPSELLREIRDGNDKALFDFAKVDKTIIVHRYVEKRIRIAQVSGDSEFFRKLGNALRWDPRKRPVKVHKRNFLLKFIAIYATEHLTMEEVCDILDKVCGIYELDVETVRKAWDRAGLNKVLPKEKPARKVE